MTGSLSLVPGTISSGRRSPVRSPDGAVGGSGRRSPSFHLSTRLRSPNEMKSFDSRSPTLRSPTRDSRRSPTNSINQDRKSPTTATCVSTQVQCGFDPDLSGDRSRARTPTGLSIPILRKSSINTYTATQRPPEVCRTSPSPSRIVIPPITVSNPTETIAIVERMNAARTAHKSPEKEVTPEKKSMMRDFFSFVKKQRSTGSTSSSTTTATTSRNRFASAFSRATISSSGSVSSGVGSPSLVRQSTYSSGTGAIPKQMSDSSSGFEPRLSFKFAKMSLRLRNRFSSERKKTTTITVQHQQQHQSEPSILRTYFHRLRKMNFKYIFNKIKLIYKN
ncbi:gprs.2 family protein [Megaselia abdita]